MREQKARALEKQSILSFSLERWNSVWRSRHHVMSRLADDNTVLFACSPFYIRDAIRRDRNAERSGISRISRNLFGYIPPRWLPTNYRFPALDRTVKAWRRAHMRRAMRRLGMREPILYI